MKLMVKIIVKIFVIIMAKIVVKFNCENYHGVAIAESSK